MPLPSGFASTGGTVPTLNCLKILIVGPEVSPSPGKGYDNICEARPTKKVACNKRN